MSSGFGLLLRYRRPWFLIGFCLLAVPMAVQMTASPEAASDVETRMLSPTPTLPQSFAQWRTLPSELDRYLADHFGLRTELIRAHGALRYAVTLPIDLRVIIGRDNWLFLNGDGTIEQATGRLLREPAISKFADRAASLQTRLQAKKARFLVAIPPNGSTINRFRLPAWAADKPAVSEYDLMMMALAARGVAANSVNPAYRRTDTHWNRLGALVAYNAVVDALREPGWAIDPDRVLAGFETVPGGDLARLLAVSADAAMRMQGSTCHSTSRAKSRSKASIRSSKAGAT